MDLLLSILASLVIVLSPQVSEAPQNVEVGIELGVDGCPIEEPCFEYEEESISDQYEIFGFAVVEDAWATFESLSIPTSSSQTPIQWEYAASYEGELQTYPETYVTLTSLTHPNVKHVFQATALTAA
jgi:hypothetical protein